MSRSIRSVLGLAALFSALLPLLANAQASPPIETPDQVQRELCRRGLPGRCAYHVLDQRIDHLPGA